MNFEERPETIRGREAEMAVSKWLQDLGWHVLPAYDYAGQGERKAPRFEGRGDDLVVPDLMAGKDGRGRWFEIKRKRHADYTYLTGREETGIHLRLMRHYQRVSEVSGLAVVLVFVHEEEDEVRIGSLGSLTTQDCPHVEPSIPTMRLYTGYRMGMGGMAFFCWQCLTVVARTSELMGRVEAA